MRLSSFKNLISELPERNHSFTIKEKNWKNEHQQTIIDSIFNNKNCLTISRGELINDSTQLEKFILKTLMWGYPIKGRGKNIDNLLKPINFEILLKILRGYINNNIKITDLIRDMKLVEGVGISTMSKFLYFLNTTVEGQKALILDRRIIEIIQSNIFEEFVNIKHIKYPVSAQQYVNYLETVNDFSCANNLKSEQVEMFIFTFGKHLSIKQNEEIKQDVILNEFKPKSYRDILIDTINNLIINEQDLFTDAINLFMNGEMADLNQTIDVGEVFNFNVNDIIASDDINVQKINELLSVLQVTIESLKNINLVSDSELNNVE